MNKFLCTRLHTIATFGVGRATCAVSPRGASGDGVREEEEEEDEDGAERWVLEDEEENRFGEEDEQEDEDKE